MMKCHKITPDKISEIPNDWICEQKMDGTRTFWREGKLVSPERDTFKSDRFIYIFKELEGINATLDGEIYCPKGTLFDVTSRVNWSICKFAVFDIMEVNGVDLRKQPLYIRQGWLKRILESKQFKYVHLVRQFNIPSRAWEMIKKQQLEGLIFKNPEGEYEEKRSKNWLKCKNFQEAVIEIIGYQPGKGKGSFIFSNGGGCSTLSMDYVEIYNKLKENGKVFAEIDYLYKTKNNKYFQPILKKLINKTEVI